MVKSSMQHQFSQVPRADIPRSSFDRSNNFKTTFNAGYLIRLWLTRFCRVIRLIVI